MFENLLNELNNMNGSLISIDIPIDDNGYIDRQCPNDECRNFFKVKFEDWKNIINDEIVYCPICKYKAPAIEWNTPEQTEYIKSYGIKVIQNKIGEAIKKDANNFNKRQKPSLISMSLEYKPGDTIITIPPSVAKELEQYYYCKKCKCRYSYLGTAYFCPACGTENTIDNINEWLSNIDNFINKYEKIENALITTLSEENVKSYLSQIMEEHYCKIVTIFQKYSEYLFYNYTNSEEIKFKKNIFQNLDESSKKWKELTGKSFEDILDKAKYREIKEHFQKRHLLTHTAGIIDENFIKKVNNKNYILGNRILITLESLNEFVTLIREFMTIMDNEFKRKIGHITSTWS